MLRLALRSWQPLLVLLVVLAGCSGGKGSISGRVILNGQPLPSGTISFHSEVGNKEVFNALITNGEYSLEGVPAGKARVTVLNTKPNGGGDANKGMLQAVVVPSRYGDPARSQLELTVEPGNQTFPVALTP